MRIQSNGRAPRGRMIALILLALLLNACAAATPATTNIPATPATTSATSVATRAPVTAETTATAIAKSAVPAEATSGPVAAPSAEVYTDPEGRYSVPIPTRWKAEQRKGFVVLSDPENLIKAYALVVPNADPAAALAEAWKQVDPSFALEPAEVQEPPPADGVEKVVTATYSDGNKQRVLTGNGQLYGGSTYVVLLDGDSAALQKRDSQAKIIETGLSILAIKPVDLRAAKPAKVDTAVTNELATFTERMLALYKVPGAAVAVVQDGKVVYINGFGVRNAETKEPMTPQTRVMIGSTGKSLTTMMMATLVDAGKMAWDTPAQQILPSFAVKDPALSKQITMRNLVCACTGVPRRDLELIFNAKNESAEDIIASLSSFEFFTNFGEAFQYSNQMVASGGYIATVADGHAPGNLLQDYAATLKARVLDPIGMPNTTISFDEVKASGNYAVPHSLNLVGDYSYVPRPIALEQVLTPAAPAGVHWSTAEDMANYLITELNAGVGPNGNRVVSAENLRVTWQPQVPVDAKTQYGLGWFVGNYKGQPLIEHGGNTLGFTSDFAFLPEAQLGILVLTNGQGTNTMSEAIRTRLFELAFAQQPQAEANATFVLQQAKAKGAEASKQITDTLDIEALTPFLGRYTNNALGDVSLVVEDNALYLDAGEFRPQLKPVLGEAGQPQAYVMIDPPVPGTLFAVKNDDAGKPTIAFEFGSELYTFTKIE